MSAETDKPQDPQTPAPRRTARTPRAFPAKRSQPAPQSLQKDSNAPAALPRDEAPERLLSAPIVKPEPAVDTDDNAAPADSSGREGLRNLNQVYRGFRWGAVFFAALMGLVTLAAGLWISSFLERMFAAQGLLGWIAAGLFALLCLAALVMITREIITLSRLSHLGRIRDNALSALNHDDGAQAKNACGDLKDLLADRKALAWTVAEMREHEADIMSARERLALAERALIVPLDTEARSLIAATAQRVSVVTALSPMGVLDVLYVASENLRLMRKVALIYGGRPGTFGLFRLARMVMTNLIVAGTMALGEDVIQQLLGHRLGAKLSARLGEGLLNGALTARVGLATITTIRPLPYIDAKPAKFSEFLKDLARAWGEKFTGRN